MKSPEQRITTGCSAVWAGGAGYSASAGYNFRLCEPAEFSLVTDVPLCYYLVRAFARLRHDLLQHAREPERGIKPPPAR